MIKRGALEKIETLILHKESISLQHLYGYTVLGFGVVMY